MTDLSSSERHSATASDRSDEPVVGRSDWNGERDYRYDDDVWFTETKAFFRTSEFWFAVLGVVAVLIAAYNDGGDSMTRDDGWRYASWILIGYVVARGLAKAGTKEPTDHR
jgi:hypothetical protein